MYDSKLKKKKSWQEKNGDSPFQQWLGWWSHHWAFFPHEWWGTSFKYCSENRQSEWMFYTRQLTDETNEPSDSDAMHSYGLGLSPKTTSWIKTYIHIGSLQSHQSELQCFKSLLNTTLGWWQMTPAYRVTTELSCNQRVVLNRCSVAVLMAVSYSEGHIYCIRFPTWTPWVWIFETINKNLLNYLELSPPSI